MLPHSQQQIIEAFWTALQNVAKEVLSQGQQYGYGYSMVEIKFKDGQPSVVISSHTESRLYKDNNEALKTIADIIQNTKTKGSQSFTIVREENGDIHRILLDEYSMQILSAKP
jgi:hypothetical protein